MIFFIVFTFVVVIPSMVALFGFRGLEERINFDKVVFYWSFGTIFVAFIGLGSLNQYLSKKSPKYEKAMGWFGSHIHNPEMSLIFQIKTKFVRWFSVQKNIVFLFIILAPVIGLLSFLTNTFLWDLPNIAQQILPIGEGILETEPAGTEVFGLWALVVFNLYIWRYFQRKNKWSDDIFWSIAVPSCIIIGILYGITFHFWIYGTSETSIFQVAIYWAVFTSIILLFANLFIVWILKDTLNFFLWLKTSQFSNEAVLINTVIISVLVIITYFAVILRKRAKKKSKV